MVQISAGGLGVPTNNVGAGLSAALREGTQGFMAGMQMKLQQERAAREQAAYEQALKKATFELGQEQQQAQAGIEAGNLIGSLGSAQAATGGIGPTESGPPISPTEGTRQKDFTDLLEHHKQVWKQAGEIMGRLPESYRARFKQDITTGMAQDAMNLKRAHVADSLHDAAVGGSLATVDPATGEGVPNPDLQKMFSEMADKVRSGDVDPQQAEQALFSTQQKINQEVGQVKQRIMLADAATQKLTQDGNSTPFQWSMIHGLRTGQISAEYWDKNSPYILAGMVQGPSGHWMTPQDAAAETAKTLAEARNINATAGHTENVKPAIEAGKLENQRAGIEARRGINLDNIASREKIAANRNQTAKEIASQRLEAAARKAATEAGFSDQKALNEALGRAIQMFKEGLIEEEDFQPKVDELTKKLTTPKPTNDGTLIDTILQEHPDWTDQQIRDEVKKRRGG